LRETFHDAQTDGDKNPDAKHCLIQDSKSPPAIEQEQTNGGPAAIAFSPEVRIAQRREKENANGGWTSL